MDVWGGKVRGSEPGWLAEGARLQCVGPCTPLELCVGFSHNAGIIGRRGRSVWAQSRTWSFVWVHTQSCFENLDGVCVRPPRPRV
eukprot:358608-Chlamydomonas_euryale.AAC.6